MADYTRMYTKLFNKVTDAIHLLQSAQIDAEEMFLSQEEPELIVLDTKDDDTTKGGGTE